MIKSPLELKPDYLVCICMDVMRSQIEQAIQLGCQDFKSLSQALGVGTGCNSCVEEVQEILLETMKNKDI